MRILLTILAAALFVTPLTPSAQAKEVSIEYFYDSLDPYGDWIQTADYGYVFHPKDVQEDWRPYTDGSWAYTDAGWTWISEEPFGAITYHYGRWTRLQDTGWVWVPDTEWAPAWVSWRRSEQYVGWAPLPPEATFKRDVGISSWSDSYYDIGPSQYTFVAGRDFGAPRLSTVILPRRQNVTIISETRNITDITYTSGGIYNGGPRYSVISRESREPVRRLRLERRDDVVFEGNRVRGEGMKATIAGDALRVFAPAVSFRTEVAPPRVSRRVERVEVDRGWRDVPQAKELRVRIQQDTPRAPANLPKQPAFTRATAALGLSDNASRKGNLDAEGKPRTEREGRSTATTGAAATTQTENTKPGERPRTATEAPLPPNGRKPATGELKPGQGRPQPATTEPGAPDAPRPGKNAGPNATAPGHEGVKPATTARPEGAPDAPRGPKEARPETSRPESARPDAPRPGSTKPETARPEERGGKKEPNVSTPGGPGEPARAPKASGAPESARPEGARPESERPGSKEPKTSAPAPAGARKEGAKPESARPEAERPGAERSGSKEPKVSTTGGEAAHPRKEGGAPEAPRHPEGNAPREGAAPAGHPSAPAGAPATAVKKGDKDKDRDKEKDKDKKGQ